MPKTLMFALGKSLLALSLAIGLGQPAWADRYYRPPRTTIHWDLHFGWPWGWSYPAYVYPYPVPPVVVVPPPSPPPVYIERPSVQKLEPGYWYYCEEANAYYPDVQSCPGPWQKIAPQPNR